MRTLKNVILISSLLLVIQGCSTENEQDLVQNQPQQEVASKPETSSDQDDTKSKENESSDTNKDPISTETTEEKEEATISKTPEIDTSVFEYAKNVEVTDSLDLTEHVNVVVYMSEDLEKGMAARHVILQTYDFLQQDRVKDAKTVTIGVMSGDMRIAQITVDMSKFKVDEEKPMIEVVMEASKIDKMNDEVKKFGESLELW